MNLVGGMRRSIASGAIRGDMRQFLSERPPFLVKQPREKYMKGWFKSSSSHAIKCEGKKDIGSIVRTG